MIPRFVYFAGVDGSGKSTYVDLLIKEFERRGLKAQRVWLRFNYLFTKPVLLYCRITGLTRRPVRGGKKISVHDFHKSAVVSVLVQYLHFIDTCINYLFKVYLQLKYGEKYIICDRFVYDIIADFIIESRDFDLPRKRIGRILLWLLPKDARVFYFKVDKDKILKRKPEVLIDDEDYDLKYCVYQELERHYRFDYLINNNGDMDDVFQGIVMEIFTQKG
ncbi:hypothetical protein JXL19_01530 [bacterium]|nr:hypothetical protein [bacterium]